MDGELKHNERDFNVVIKMTNNNQRTNHNTKENEDKSTKIVRPSEELDFKKKQYGLGYEKDHGNLFHIHHIVNQLHL